MGTVRVGSWNGRDEGCRRSEGASQFHKKLLTHEDRGGWMGGK